MRNPRFLRGDWLADEVEERLGDPECYILLLPSEPDVGKSIFFAVEGSERAAHIVETVAKRLGDVGIVAEIDFVPESEIAATENEFREADRPVMVISQP